MTDPRPMTKEEIRALRQQLGLSQGAFAARLGLSSRSHSTVSRWESENQTTMPDARSNRALWLLFLNTNPPKTANDAHIHWLR